MPSAALSRLAARFDALTAPPTPAVAVEFAAGRVVAGSTAAGGAPRIAVRMLPEGAIAPSAVRPNLADPAAVVGPLRALLESVGAVDAAVALLVPDLTARVSVLDFDVLPARREELEPLARFRLRKSLPFAEEQAVISCQVLSPTRLLVAIADRARLDEYEDCLEAAGARAATVLPSGLAALAAQPVLNHGALLIRAARGSLTTAFCWHERVEFFRAIEIQDHGAEAEASFEDVFPSVAFFRDRVESGGAGEPGPWVLYAAGARPELEARLREEIPWAELRPAETPDELAVAGALRGRFA